MKAKRKLLPTKLKNLKITKVHRIWLKIFYAWKSCFNYFILYLILINMFWCFYLAHVHLEIFKLKILSDHKNLSKIDSKMKIKTLIDRKSQCLRWPMYPQYSNFLWIKKLLNRIFDEFDLVEVTSFDLFIGLIWN